MTVQEIMTRDVACCTPDTSLNQVARLMVEHDCGEIPVIEGNGRLVGVITDRDICCRAVAEDAQPSTTQVAAIMSSPVVSANLYTSMQECERLMKQNLVRRIPVVDDQGKCCGIVSQADIAKKCDGEIEGIIKPISEATPAASKVPSQ